MLESAPAAALGATLSTKVPEIGLLLDFAAFDFGLGAYMLFDQWRVLRAGRHIHPVTPRREHERVYRGIGIFAGLLQGAIAAGRTGTKTLCQVNS